MSYGLPVLLLTTVSIGFFHTIMGPDHYLPFTAMSRSRRWSLRKTALITLLCGIGHVGSSVILGLLGVGFGIAVNHLEMFESFRGRVAAWAFICFGLVYFIYGIRRAIRNQPHRHTHSHNGEEMPHSHMHTHHDEHLHVHAVAKSKRAVPWTLFIIFLLGPCEPLIPLLMYPAANNDIMGIILVAGSFAFVTIFTMLAVVLISTFGAARIRVGGFERYGHAIAGFIILMCGAAIEFLGL